MGATALGGSPEDDPDPAGFLDVLVEAAAEHGTDLDLHTEGDDPAALDRVAAAAGGLRGGVGVGPCAGLSRLPGDVLGRTAERLAGAGVSVIALPQGNCAFAGSPRPAGDGSSRYPERSTRVVPSAAVGARLPGVP
ncbi:hypothetical protein HCN52_19895, partial [Streptomyces bohaiensis]|nr:hypothetical protein [Streptomyces bohaiensis]